RTAPRPHAPRPDRADRIGEFWGYPESRLRRAPDRLRGRPDPSTVLVGMMRENFMGLLVGARGFEPLASSASRKRSTPELSARSPAWYRRAEAGPGIGPVYRVLQTLA